jgi:putative addiction module component (TIGR02574 family)
MSRPLDDIDYLSLSVGERLVLVQDILDSVMAEAQADLLTPEQLAEIQRRCEDIDAGRVTCVPWDQARGRFLGGG